jgi:nucleoid-associated protein YgaU
MDLNPLNLLKHVKGKLTVDPDNMDAEYSELEFMYNPKSYKIAKKNNFQQKPTANTKDGPDKDYKGADNATLDLELYLDDWEDLIPGDNSVSHAIETLLAWVGPTQTSIDNDDPAPEPPILDLDWGGPKFKGHLTSVTVDVSLFRKDGTPARATANISMTAVADPKLSQNPTSGSLHSRKTHVLADGDSLQSLAYGEYHDPNLWRGLAAFNGVDDPMRLRPGTSLLIPTAAEAARLT